MTDHQSRIIRVRERVTRALPKMKYSGKPRVGGFTVHGAFADLVAAKARETGVWPWKQKELSTTGAPKDLSTCIRRFLDGRGTQEAILDLFEAVCIDIERAHRERHGPSRDVAEKLLAGSELTPAEPEPEYVHGTSLRKDQVEPLLPTMLPTIRPHLDGELLAMSVLSQTLEPLDDDAKVRVFQYLMDRFGVELG